jgi:hypothetical protein
MKELRPCGTKAAKQRHKARGETCAACTPPPPKQSPCGSYNARRRHKRRGETCETCGTHANRLAPCGTEAARRRHQANKQTCDTCGPINYSRPAPQPCGTPAAFQRHKRHGQEPCDPCRVAYRAADAAKRRKNPATTAPRSETNLNDLLTEIRFLLNAGEGEHRILQATGYEGRAKSLRCRLTKAGHHDLAAQVFNTWELAA